MKKIISIMSLFLMLLVGSPMAGAEIRASDFSVRGVVLDKPASMEALTKAFGEVLFDRDKSVFGWHVKYYVFDRHIFVGVFGADERVVDIVIEDEKYVGRDNVRYGATRYCMARAFGKGERVPIDGMTYSIYRNPENKKERLMLRIDPMMNTLMSWRITSLPLTVEEADEQFDDWESSEVNAYYMREHGIDMSAIEREKRSGDDGRFTKFEGDGIDGGSVIDNMDEGAAR
ncbi:MAG: hypothetical protein IJT82_00670 [Schwartzia sp.]|nr:hypothetical protein [Schwartzia sp. (in: firmicutes)]